jgi:type IV secretory pathway TrbD component
MYNDVPEGFEVPIYHALLRPKLLLGAPRTFTVFVFIGTAIAVLWHAWPVFPLAVILQGFAAWGTRQDPNWFSIVLRCWFYKRYYEV